MYLSMVSLDGVYMGATVWRQDKLFILLFYSGVPNGHVKQAHSKPLVQLSTFKVVPQGSLGFTANNVEGRKDLWYYLMHRKWNCCYNVVSIGKPFTIAMATQVSESDHRHIE